MDTIAQERRARARRSTRRRTAAGKQQASEPFSEHVTPDEAVKRLLHMSEQSEFLCEFIDAEVAKRLESFSRGGCRVASKVTHPKIVSLAECLQLTHNETRGAGRYHAADSDDEYGMNEYWGFRPPVEVVNGVRPRWSSEVSSQDAQPDEEHVQQTLNNVLAGMRMEERAECERSTHGPVLDERAVLDALMADDAGGRGRATK